MDDFKIKTKIQDIANIKYEGKYRFFKKALTISIIGIEAYNRICNKIDKSLHTSHSLMIYCFMNDILSHPICTCGNNVKFNTTTRKFMTYCSNTCRFDNSDTILEIRKQTNIEKYGTSNYLASTEGKLKIKTSNIERYGVDNYTKTDEYKASIQGRKRSEKTKQKIQDSNRIHFYNSISSKYPSCEPLFKIEDYVGVKGYIQYPWLCKTCNNTFTSSFDNGSSPVCTTCKPVGTKHEKELKTILDNLGISYQFRNRKILSSGKELDLYIPDKNMAIEIGGLYWHSTAGPSYSKNDHISKLEECELNGIRLITIYDDEMYHNKSIVRSRLKNILGKNNKKIYARKCKIIDITSPTCNKFLNKYHIQGAIGGSYKYGLTYKNRLVAVMTFNKGRIVTGNKSNDNIYELGRYCTIANFSIIGGASKLFKHFLKEETPNEIFSYADRRWSQGELYNTLEFKFIKNTVPNYWYTKDFKSRIHRFKFRKKELINMLNYDPSLTEEEIMKREKYFKTWDCGSKLYRYIVN